MQISINSIYFYYILKIRGRLLSFSYLAVTKSVSAYVLEHNRTDKTVSRYFKQQQEENTYSVCIEQSIRAKNQKLTNKKCKPKKPRENNVKNNYCVYMMSHLRQATWITSIIF